MIVNKKTNRVWILIFLLPVLVLYALYFLYPLGFLAVTSTLEWNGITQGKFVGLGNFLNNFQSRIFRISLKNNLIWLLANGILQVGMAAAVAVILARQPRGWRFLRTVYFLPNVISQVAIAMMWAALYNAEYGAVNQVLKKIGLENLTRSWLGEINTALPAIIVHQIFYIGYFMIIILAAVMTIPQSLYEAAKIDGASVWQQEMAITLPMIKNILITSMTLAMAYGLRHFESTFLLTKGGPADRTSVLGILMYKRLNSLDYGKAASTGVTLVILGMLVIVIIRCTVGRRSSASDMTQ